MNVLSPSISISESDLIKESTAINPEVADLIRRCMQNDRAAQEQLYKRYYGKMMGTCMRYLGNEDEARDVLNTGFLKVFQNLSMYSGQGSFEGWIYQIIRNAIFDQFRKRLKFREQSLTNELEDQVGVDAGVMQHLYAKDLLKMLQELPETTRVVFNMFAIEGFRHEEIATALSISAGTSKWHVSEARRILKQKLEHKSEKP